MTVYFPEIFRSLVVYRLVHPPVTRESGVRLPARETYFCFRVSTIRAQTLKVYIQIIRPSSTRFRLSYRGLVL